MPHLNANCLQQLIELESKLASPALIYDFEKIMQTINSLRNDLSVLGSLDMLFAIKANRCPALLQRMASIGLGADVASYQELKLALNAGMNPIYLTTPVLTRELMHSADKHKVYVDLDNLQQVMEWGDERSLNREIGLRIKVPLDPFNKTNDTDTWSRFGVNPTDRNLHRYLNRNNLKVRRLHIHAGELHCPSRVKMLAEMLLATLSVFPYVDEINLGGGLTYLYSSYQQAKEAWQILKEKLVVCDRELRFVLEPGMLLVVSSGYLLTTVKSISKITDDHRLVTLDSSAWNLATWTTPLLESSIPIRRDAFMQYDIAGNTCYEKDYFVKNINLPELQLGDRLIWRGFGAYTASMARSSHGLPLPPEWLIEGTSLVSGVNE